jgi:hypothetical protein
MFTRRKFADIYSTKLVTIFYRFLLSVATQHKKFQNKTTNFFFFREKSFTLEISSQELNERRFKENLTNIFSRDIYSINLATDKENFFKINIY